MTETLKPTHTAAVYVTLVLAVVASAWLGVFPGVGDPHPGDSLTSHPYRLAMAVTLAALAVVLGVLSARWGREHGGPLAGVGALLAGGIVTGALLGAAPWFLYPNDQYPVSFMWLLVGAPVGLAAWLLASFSVYSARPERS